MNAVAIIARQELANGLRNRWIVAAALLLAGLSLALTFLGSAPTGTVGSDHLTVLVVSLASLSVFLVPLIALMLSFDAIVGEAERGSLLLLLAYPVERGQVLLGKFAGHTAVLTIATLLGYGAAGIAAATVGGPTDAWPAFAVLVATSVLLGAAFVAMGYVASVVVRERATAAGLALGIWLLFVVLFDLALLGLLVAGGESIVGETTFRALLLLNPTDVFRLVNLLGFEEIEASAGLAAVAAKGGYDTIPLIGVLLLWIAVPLGAAWIVFRHREV